MLDKLDRERWYTLRYEIRTSFHRPGGDAIISENVSITYEDDHQAGAEAAEEPSGRGGGVLTALVRLPDDWRPVTWALEMLTGAGIGLQWHTWGFIDGWNWVVEGRPISLNIRSDRDDGESYYQHRAMCFLSRLRAMTIHAEFLSEDYEFAYMEGYDDGVRAADKEASNPVSHIGESLGTEPPSLNVVSEEEDPESMADSA